MEKKRDFRFQNLTQRPLQNPAQQTTIQCVEKKLNSLFHPYFRNAKIGNKNESLNTFEKFNSN